MSPEQPHFPKPVPCPVTGSGFAFPDKIRVSQTDPATPRRERRMFPNRLRTPNRGHSRIPKAAALPEPGGSPGQRRYRRDGGGRLHLEHFLSSSPLFPSLCAQNFCSVWVRAGRSGRGSPAAGAPLREPLVPSQPAGLGKGPGSAPLLVPISPAPSSAPRGAWNPAASRPHGSASLSPRASLCPAGVTLPALGAPYPHAPPPPQPICV